MKYFGTQTNYLLDKSKPYQRPKLRHAGPTSVNREAELERPSRVACSDLLAHVCLTSSPSSPKMISRAHRAANARRRTPEPGHEQKLEPHKRDAKAVVDYRP